ncbi:hypothetical protein DB30_05228 [Enhygromyxa salina]|uniref:Uncharacterized protein n=1 Tax=Enhygromyxa salina TaxID=215803 RepID=A0A0C2D1X4_9BACT|nr:hypothetical protein [Enhygromyxa salina]KIG15810.1 hypothetical protein DB30_05228 [Enhygromyxa salina]
MNERLVPGFATETRCASIRLVELMAPLVAGLTAGAPCLDFAGLLATLRERASATRASAPLELGPELRAAYAELRRVPHLLIGSDERLGLWGSAYAPALDALMRAAADEATASATIVARVCELLPRTHAVGALDEPDELPRRRLFAELCVHTIFTLAALEALPRLTRTVDDPERSPAWLYARCELSAVVLASLHAAAGAAERSWYAFGLLAVERELPELPKRGAVPPCRLEIRPLFRSSAARWLDADHEDIAPRSLVFPSGTRFAVLSVEEDAEGVVVVRLAERSHLAARLAERLPIPELDGQPLYHYTLGRSLPGIIDDGEIGVAAALPGTNAPSVWLTTHADWEPSAVKSVTEGDLRRELGREELAKLGEGLFRIRVDPRNRALSWPCFAELCSVSPMLVERLDTRGRERGADPSEWFCCPEAVPAAFWLGIEMYQPELGWVELDM